jgi:hypothetical protein
MTWLLPPPLPPSPVSKLDRWVTHRETEKEKQLADGRAKWRGEEGAKLPDAEKAWSSLIL